LNKNFPHEGKKGIYPPSQRKAFFPPGGFQRDEKSQSNKSKKSRLLTLLLIVKLRRTICLDILSGHSMFTLYTFLHNFLLGLYNRRVPEAARHNPHILAEQIEHVLG